MKVICPICKGWGCIDLAATKVSDYKEIECYNCEGLGQVEYKKDLQQPVEYPAAEIKTADSSTECESARRV